MSDFIHLYPISVTISIFTLTAVIFFTLTPNIPIPFIAIPQHITNILIALLKILHNHFW